MTHEPENFELGNANSVFGAPLEVKFANDASAPGTFEGRGACFGNVDSQGDLIEPGAFSESLAKWRSSGRGFPPMLKMHGTAGGNVNDPIGVWEHMAEDSTGLLVKGRLIGLDTEQGRWTYSQLKEGALTGLSIGYRVAQGGSRKGSGKPGEPTRILSRLDLREVSLVDQPSNARALVYAVKRASPLELKSQRDLEDLLRKSGLAKGAARKLATVGWPVLQATPSEEQFESEVARLATKIEAAAAELKGKL